MSTNYVRKFIEEVKNLSGLINFDCVDCFKKKIWVNGVKGNKQIVGIGCCENCHSTLGYAALNINTVDKFDDEFGFWREGKGCILDRRDRSNICLLYTCKGLSEEYNKIAHVITSFISEVRVPITDQDKPIDKRISKILGKSRAYNRSKLETKIIINRTTTVWPECIPIALRRKIMRLRRLAIKQMEAEGKHDR